MACLCCACRVPVPEALMAQAGITLTGPLTAEMVDAHFNLVSGVQRA